MVATFNPSWRNITAALRLAVVGAGGVPSVSVYPANWGGAVQAIDELRAAIVAAGSAASTMAAHVAAADPHAQYALDTDLAAYATSATLSSHTGNTSNPHSATAAQVGAIATAAAGAASGVATLDGSVKVPIAQIPTGTSGMTVPFGNDARLSDTRIPTDGTVTNAKVDAAAAIAWSKISKSGAVASDISAAPATHSSASANVHGLPASVNVLGNRNAAGEFIQHGNATVTGSLGTFTLNSFRSSTVTFPVAFATTPRVFASGSNTGPPITTAIITTTTFTMYSWGDATLGTTSIGNYIALGT